MKVISASGFWRNDQPGGVGLQLMFRPDGEGNRLLLWAESMFARFDKAGPARAQEFLIAQGKKGAVESNRDAWVTIATIHWLEERRHIPSDDVNGVLWVAVRDDGALVQFRADIPSHEHLRLVKKHLPPGSEIRVEYRGLEETLDEYLGSN